MAVTSDNHGGLSRMAADLQRVAELASRAAAPRALVFGVEALLAVAIAVLLARIVMPWLTPLPAPTPADAAPQALQVSGPINPFGDAPPAAVAPVAADAVETDLDLALHGTWIDASGASAIIRTPDGKQDAYRIDDTVCCGATLVAVFADRVILDRGGAREALLLPNREMTPRSPASVPAADASSADPAMPALAEIARIETGGGAGALEFRLFPGDDAEAFLAAGLRPGDLLVAIDDNPAPPDMASLLAMLVELRNQKTVQVTVEREGVHVPLDVDLAAAGGL